METFKEIPWFPGYEITNEWTVRNKKSGYILKRKNHWKGYHIVDLCWKHHRLHRLVMLTFVWPSELQVNHKNWIKTDNRIENLEYVSWPENIKHAFDVWLWDKRKRIVEQRTQEWILISTFESHSDAARRLWFDQWAISKCVKWEYRTYKWFVWI